MVYNYLNLLNWRKNNGQTLQPPDKVFPKNLVRPSKNDLAFCGKG
jgi:hypothetical protein